MKIYYKKKRKILCYVRKGRFFNIKNTRKHINKNLTFDDVNNNISTKLKKKWQAGRKQHTAYKEIQ